MVFFGLVELILLGFLSFVSGAAGALVGILLARKQRRPSRRHVLPAFAVPLLLTIFIATAGAAASARSGDPGAAAGKLLIAVVVVAGISSAVFAVPYLCCLYIVYRRWTRPGPPGIPPSVESKPGRLHPAGPPDNPYRPPAQ